jgi:hypothetical protein
LAGSETATRETLRRDRMSRLSDLTAEIAGLVHDGARSPLLNRAVPETELEMALRRIRYRLATAATGGHDDCAPRRRPQTSVASIVSAPRARATDTRWWPSRTA